ncbi:MAG: alpha/beta hydrolase [Bdellovibrionota bacterium]
MKMTSSDHILYKFCQKHSIAFHSINYNREKHDGNVSAIFLRPLTQCKGLALFAHATGNDHSFPQVTLFKNLLKADYALFSFDLDGHGLNSTTKFTHKRIRSSLSQAVREARKHEPKLPIHLIGQSLGGALILDYVANNKHNIQSLSLIGVPIYLTLKPNAYINELISLASHSMRKEIITYGPWGIIPAFGAFKRNTFPLRTFSSLPRSSKLEYVDEVMSTLEDINLVESAKKIKTPTLLCYGNRDKIAPVEHGELLFENLSESHLVTVFNETHFSLGFSEESISKIINWLNKH